MKNEKKVRRLGKEAIDSLEAGKARVLRKALSEEDLKNVAAGGSRLCGYSGMCLALHQL